MLDLRAATFDYEPYPIGVIAPVLEQELYERLQRSYPPKELFEFKPALGNKYSLSELSNASSYRSFIRSHDEWRRFHAYVKGDLFIPAVLALLSRHRLDLGLRRYKTVSRHRTSSRASSLSRLLRIEELSARFEFSMMDADGGHILPHTDSPQKLVTLVLSMMAADEWNPAWGGGTDVVLPRDRTRSFNHMNESLPFADVEVLKTFSFKPNHCVIFIKTFNSWHSVSPMRGAGTSAMRKTLTINIEAKA